MWLRRNEAMWAAIHRREPDALDESEWTTVAWTCPWLSWTRGMSRAHQAFSSFWSVSVDVHGSSPELQTIPSASCGGFSRFSFTHWFLV